MRKNFPKVLDYAKSKNVTIIDDISKLPGL